ncbi:tetratricopeptide repeat protein [Chryseobacterium sp. JK1]|uniref:tetratricopeptide repeat protein n=1 Tax=Chryseobacterium sp. JK1 TaxID=874294 RepID=UPI003D6926DA
MIKKLLLLFYLIICIKTYSQSEKLRGEWFLDKIVKPDGKNLEINNPRYSTFLFYEINPDELSINNTKFKAKFSKDLINLDNRTFKYWFEEDYLILQEGNEISLLLKAEDFIKRNSEFKPQIEIRNSDSLLVANKVIHPIFNNDKTFDEFIIPLMKQEASKDMDDLYFKIEYILTKNNKIKQIKILDKRTPQYDTQFIQALKQAEKYFENPYGKDLLVTDEKHFLKWYHDLSDKSEKDLFNNTGEGLRYYNNNKFEKAVEYFSRVNEYQPKDNRFVTEVHNAYIKLGISYLAIGKTEQACNSFRKAGDLTDFEVRNYLKDFCK